MTIAEQIVAGLLEDPTTQALLDGKPPEVVQSLRDRWQVIVSNEIAAASPAAPTVAATAPAPVPAPAAAAAPVADAPTASPATAPAADAPTPDHAAAVAEPGTGS